MQMLFRWILVFTMSVLAASCGGGSSSGGTSSGGGASGGGPVQTDTIRISQSSIQFLANQFEELPDPISVTATISGSNTTGIVFGTLPGVDGLPSWLDFQTGSFANNSVSANFLITRTDLPPGNYDFTVRAVSFDASENVLDTVDMQVRYSITEGIPISVSPASLDVVMHYESETIVENVTVTSGNYDWSVLSSDAGSFPSSGNGNQDIEIRILPPMREDVDTDGNYQGRVDISQNQYSNRATFLINYTVFPTLSLLSDDAISFTAIAGSDPEEQVGINLQGEGLDWDVTTNVNWIELSATSGTINTSDDLLRSPEGDDFSISVNTTNLSSGTYNGVITLTAVAGQSLDIPVSIEVGAQRLSASKYGIAFVDMPASANLETAVTLYSNTDSEANWTATSDAAWINVTPSGTTDEVIVVTADPSVLASEVMSYANITISSPDTQISNTEVIKIGLWKSAQAPSNAALPFDIMFADEIFRVIADPIRPLVYVKSGEDEISIINVYSANVEVTLPTPREYTDFEISDDGEFLFLISSGDNEGFIDVLDLTLLSFTNQWSYPVERLLSRDTQSLAYSRLAGEPLLFTSTHKILSAVNGEDFGSVLENPSALENLDSLDVNQNILCGVRNRNDDFLCYDLFYGNLDGSSVISTQRGGNDNYPGFVSEAIELSPDGEDVYFLLSSLSIAKTSDLSTAELVLGSQSDQMQGFDFDADGNLIISFIEFTESVLGPNNPPEERRYFTIYDKDLNAQSMLNPPPVFAGEPVSEYRDLTFSSDGKRLIFLNTSNRDGISGIEFYSIE